MSEKVNPVVPVKLDKERHLKFTLMAIKKFSEMTGIDVIKNGININELEAEQFRTLIYCGLLHEDGGLDYKKITRRINKKNAVLLYTAMNIAIQFSMPDKAEVKEKSKKDKDKEDFDWLKVWSFGRYTLKLPEKDFWGLTLGQLAALLKRYESAEERLDYRTAVIASQILNTIPRAKENRHKVFQPADIFPGYGWSSKKYPIPEELKQKTIAIFSLFRGDEKVNKNG